MNARADFEQCQAEQEHMQQCLEVLRRVENWQHTKDDVLFLASEMGLSTIYQTGEKHEMAR